MSKSFLKGYNEKRDFRKTGEPRGQVLGADNETFVVQKHDATTLHYDFRIALNGVLKSWAIPKGPSTNTRDKRLAIRTEDHPLAYADFEGVIPAGEYGGGTVIVWDKGTYRSLKDSGDSSLLHQLEQEGHIAIWLEGKKLKGGYALTRTGGNQWLFVKMRDKEADALRDPVNTQPESVLTGLTIEEVRAHIFTPLMY